MSNIIPFNAKTQKRTIEAVIQKKLAEQSGGQVEVPTESGRIDVLTSTEIIEIKRIDQWKSALGQVLAYGIFYPSHQKRLHLFGSYKNESYLDFIKETCKNFDVIISWEDGGEGEETPLESEESNYVNKEAISIKNLSIVDINYLEKKTVKIGGMLEVDTYRIGGDNFGLDLLSVLYELNSTIKWLTSHLDKSGDVYKTLRDRVEQNREIVVYIISVDDFTNIVSCLAKEGNPKAKAYLDISARKATIKGFTS